MPDVLTHLLVGASVALLVQRDGNRVEQALVILGAVIIDIERPVTWILSRLDFDWIGLTSAFHSILGAVVLSYFAAACFVLEDTPLRTRFGLIFLGCASHLFLDTIMYPWSELGIPFLYPLKLVFSFHFFWPDFWFYPLFGVIVLTTVLIVNRYIDLATSD